MNSITSAIPKEIFSLITGNTDIKTVFRCALVDKKWALFIIDNNELWQHLIRRDFKITPGKYLNLGMSREEYKFLFLHMKKVFAEGGVYAGSFSTEGKNKYYIFPELHVDTEERAFICGSSKTYRTTTMAGAPLHLPGSFLCSKNGITFVLQNEANNTYQLLDSKLSLITSITSNEKLLTFEVLEQGLITGSESGSIELWNFNGDSFGAIGQTEGMVLNLFSTQLPGGKPAILAWHYADSIPTISLYGIDGERLEQKNLETLKNIHITAVNKLSEDQFAIILNKDDKTGAYIISTKHDPIPLSVNSQIKNMSISEGKIYILEDDMPTDGYEKSIRVWDADGQYLGKIIRLADKINVINSKIYLRNAFRFEVEIYDLNFLPKDSKAWHLDLNNFNAFPDEDKNQICGIFYCLIKPELRPYEDYFGCAQHAFYGSHFFAFRFDDSLRKQALLAHVLLKDMHEAVVMQNEAATILCFNQLPKTIQGSLGWGIWVFEGMPMGDPNFGSNFFHTYPTHNSVNNAIQCFRENGRSVLPYQCSQEIRASKEILNNSSTQEAIIFCLQNLSPITHEIIKKCIEVLEGLPITHEHLLMRYSSDAYKNGADNRDPLILSINNLYQISK